MATSDFYLEDENSRFLLVWEGNFSFAVDLLEKIKNKLTATCLNSKDEIMSDLKLKNIAEVRKKGGTVYTDVDATQLNNHPIISKYKFGGIIFNFPHIPGKMKINENRKLLRNFFCSAKSRLDSNGKIYVTLCKGQSGIPIDDKPRKWNDSWQIVDLAFYADLILTDLRSFKPEDFPYYKCSGFRGNEKSFNIDGAMTFIFSHGTSAVENLVIPEVGENKLLVSQLQLSIKNDLQKLKKIETCKEHPIHRMFYTLASEIKVAHNFISNDLLQNALFCTHHEQLAILCKPVLFEKLQFKCCEIAFLKALVNYAVPKLRNDNIFITKVTCVPCRLFSSCFPQFSQYILIYVNDFSNIVTSLKFILNLIFANAVSITDHFDRIEMVNYFNVENYDKFLDSLLDDVPKPFCDTLNEIINSDLEANKMYVRIANIIATYSIEFTSGYIVYDKVTFVIKNHDNTASHADGKSTFCIGGCYCVSYRNNLYYYITLDVIYAAMFQCNISCRQILYDDHSFYTKVRNRDNVCNVYRPLTIYSPKYTHDISFWISEKFYESTFLLVIKNTAGDYILNINQIDSYFDDCNNKQSLCYRIIYHTLYHPLSKEKARQMNIQLRHILKLTLDVELR